MGRLNGHPKPNPPGIDDLGPSCGYELFSLPGEGCWDCPHHERRLIETETGRPLCYASVCREGEGSSSSRRAGSAERQTCSDTSAAEFPEGSSAKTDSCQKPNPSPSRSKTPSSPG